MIWSPLNCGCCIELNDTIFVESFRGCSRHTGLTGQALADRLLDESRTQGNAYQELIKVLPQHTALIDDERGQIHTKLKDDVVDFVFDTGGNLTVIPRASLTTKERNDTQTILTTKFGSKVQLQ